MFTKLTPDGSNVFFVTASQLLAQDTDTAYDIYDARECSQASPCQSAPVSAEPGCATVDGCRAASPPVQAPVSPGGSSTFTGPGNIVVLPPSAKQEQKAAKSTAKKPTRAQKLTKALHACHKQHNKHKRKTCEKHARELYGVKHPPKPQKAQEHRKTLQHPRPLLQHKECTMNGSRIERAALAAVWRGFALRFSLMFLASAVIVAVGMVGSASAAGPWWQLNVEASPSNLAPGGEGLVSVAASNLGDAPANGASTTVTPTLSSRRG